MCSAKDFRKETDSLGEKQIPADALWGIHTARAVENFSIALRPVHPGLVRAYGAVKLACAQVNRTIGVWEDESVARAIEAAAREMMEGKLTQWIVVDALQGGAGTSTNMNVNEVIANRALELLGKPFGAYDHVSPSDDVNIHQSTNDTFPTALRCAALTGFKQLEVSLVSLQEAFQLKEKEFAGVVKVGRTELQDAALITLGAEAAAWAEAVNRDRWRIYKCEERLRVVNLGGTAVGTGLGAPRQFIFAATDTLREITGLNLARAENLVDATQNADVFVEVSGMLSACASSLIKICNDLRLLSSGPQAGLAEIILPPMQAGSSIMPAKVNPVIPEAAIQAAMLVIGNHTTISMAASGGSLELNHLMPLIAHCFLESIDCLTRAVMALSDRCVRGIIANPRSSFDPRVNTAAALSTLVGSLGHETAERIAAEMLKNGKTLNQSVSDVAGLSNKELLNLLSAESVCRLGSPAVSRRRKRHE